MKAKLYLHPAAIPHAREVEEATGTVAAPTPAGTAVQLLRRMPPSWEVCRGPDPWEEG